MAVKSRGMDCITITKSLLRGHDNVTSTSAKAFSVVRPDRGDGRVDVGVVMSCGKPTQTEGI